MVRAFVRSTQATWQKIFCRGAHGLSFIGIAYYALFFIHKYKPELLEGVLFSPSLFFGDFSFHLSLGAIGFIFISICVCLNDAVQRKERLFVSESDIRRSSAYGFLALLTSLTDEATAVSRKNWRIPRAEVKRIIVSTHMITIEHMRGCEYLAASEWCSEESIKRSDSFPDVRKDSEQPSLILALKATGYPVEFKRSVG